MKEYNSIKMEEELIKSYTDCVYFLASPFTCKKGEDCEYRHSDAARLNPRDCWYWLSGTCANLMCPFRHPPLDVPTEVLTEAASYAPYQSSLPGTKTTVPCYYYYIGCCNKGDSCRFFHEPGDTFAPNAKVEKVVTDGPMASLGSKSFGRINTGPAHAEKIPTLTVMATNKCNGSQTKRLKPTEHASIEYIQDPNTSVQTHVPECEETAVVEDVTSQTSEDLPKCEPSLGSETSDQYSEELIDGNIVRDGWWESSPGFDLLVDGQTHDMAYEDDLEYLPPHVGSDRDPDPVFVQYGFEAGPDEIEMVNNSLYEVSEDLNDGLRATHGSSPPRYTRSGKARNIVSLKRKFYSLGASTGGFDHVDLRDHLTRKRIIDCHQDTYDLTHNLVQRRHHRLQRFARHRPNHCLHGRLPSRVERNGIWFDRRISPTAASFRGRLRNSQQSDNRRQRRNFSAAGQPGLSQQNGNGRQRRKISAAGQPKFVPWLTKVIKPKGVAEIEKDRRRGNNNKNMSVDFEGPKPLSEILKEKKKTVICEDSAMTGCF